MRDCLKMLTVGLVLAGSLPVPLAQAAANRVLARQQPVPAEAAAKAPVKGETCQPKWPYVVLTCVA